MEDTLRDKAKDGCKGCAFSLNPCFNGRYSQSEININFINIEIVLILVLMEDTLRAGRRPKNLLRLRSLNPCFNGRYSQSTL